MSRLIDAEALSKAYMRKGKDKLRLATVINELELAPTIDAVPVVRCRECKYYRHGKHFTDINFCQRLPYYAEKGGLNTSDDDFCSRGERRDDDG